LTDELRRAELTVARCKEVIRQSLRYCQAVSDSEVIPQDAVDSEGEVDVSDIFCAKCKESSSSDDNDLVLCDGPCNRAFHECCLHPRLVAADLPEDEGWLCPACDAKVRELGGGGTEAAPAGMMCCLDQRLVMWGGDPQGWWWWCCPCICSGVSVHRLPAQHDCWKWLQAAWHHRYCTIAGGQGTSWAWE
jgi:hypothetical protein